MIQIIYRVKLQVTILKGGVQDALNNPSVAALDEYGISVEAQFVDMDLAHGFVTILLKKSGRHSLRLAFRD